MHWDIHKENGIIQWYRRTDKESLVLFEGLKESKSRDIIFWENERIIKKNDYERESFKINLLKLKMY